MDPRPSKMLGIEPGKPSPMVQKVINARRSQPYREPKKALSSDNDTGGGVSLLPTRPSSPQATTGGAATYTNTTTAPDGHGLGQSGTPSPAHQQSAEDDVSLGNSDYSLSSNSSASGVQLEPTTKPFNAAAGQPQKATKSSIASNLTAKAKSFVPQSASVAKNAPSMHATTTTSSATGKGYNNNTGNGNNNNNGFTSTKHRSGPTNSNWRTGPGASTTGSHAGNNSGQDKASKHRQGDAFSNQFEDSRKLMDLMAFSEDENTSTTPRSNTNTNSRVSKGPTQPRSSQHHSSTMAPSSGAGAAATSPARTDWVSGPINNGVLDAINSSTSQGPGASNRAMGNQQAQPQISTSNVHPTSNTSEAQPSTVAPKWARSRLMNETSKGGNGNHDNSGLQNSPASTMKTGQQGHQGATPGRGAQNTWVRHRDTAQLTPNRAGGGTNYANVNANTNAQQHTPAMTKASDKDLADVKQRLMNFANGSTSAGAPSPTTTTDADATAPISYRGGLPGSASESTLDIYTRRAPAPAPAPAAPTDAMSPTPSEERRDRNGGDADSEEDERMRMIMDDEPDISKMYSRELKELISPSEIPLIARLRGRAFPFEPSGRVHVKRGEGVVHYVNIPFDLDIPALVAHLGRSSRMLHPVLEGIHITMENVTGKTCEAYVETLTMKDSMDIVARHERRQADGHIDRLGDRPVEMDISSPDALLQAVFKAGSTGVEWRGGNPMIKEPPMGQKFGYFKEFVPAEDLTMLVKHAETQTTFSRQCPERPYECLISILVLMPWSSTEHITIKTRSQIYAAVIELLKLLRRAITDGKFNARLTPQLRNRLARAAMLCPGFTPLMKDNIVALAGISEQEACQAYNQPRGAHLWLHQYGIGVKLGVPLDVLEYYIAVIREETTRAVDELPMGERQEIQKLAERTSGYWGYFWRELNYPVGPDFDNMTLAEAARRELNTIDAILQRAVSRQQQQDQQQMGGYPHPGPSSLPGQQQQQQQQLGYHHRY